MSIKLFFNSWPGMFFVREQIIGFESNLLILNDLFSFTSKHSYFLFLE